MVEAEGPARFSCTLCGDCCTGAQVVRLTGFDLGLLVRRLNLSSVLDLRSRGLVSVVREPVGTGRYAWRPRIRFRSRPLAQCPFLINDVDAVLGYRGLCSLHPDAKPLVCSLSPLSRVVEESDRGAVTEDWSIVPPVADCPGMGRGEVLTAAAPAWLRPRLDEEAAWMRRLIAATPRLADESAAWGWLAGESVR